MGNPHFSPVTIGLNVVSSQLRYTITVAGISLTFGAVSMGNPHAVILVDKIETAHLDRIGAELNTPSHSLFKQGVNVSYMRVIDSHHIELAVYERGVGRTLGCGSGACAATVVGQRWGMLAQQVQVTLPGGQLQVLCTGTDAPVWMRGDAHYVFRGEICPKDFKLRGDPDADEQRNLLKRT